MSPILNVRIPNTLIGLGAINTIANVVKDLPHSKILIISDPGIIKAGILALVKEPLEKAGLKFEVFGDCASNPPIGSIEKTVKKVKAGKYDLLIGVGGGSVMDFTKVISQLAADDSVNTYDLIGGQQAKRAMAKVLIPTTSGTGSEWSTTALVTDEKSGNQKWGITNDRNIPEAVIIDPELTRNLPPRVTADTGMDALVHAIESYTSYPANTISDMFALTAIKLICDNIGLAYSKGEQKIEARYNMSIAASIAMYGAVVSGVGIAHFLGHPLEKRVHVTHGVSCTLMLPYAMEFNLIACPEKFARIAEIMGEPVAGLSVFEAATKSATAVRMLSKSLGMPQTLSDIGIQKSQIPEMAEETVNSYGSLIKMWNPRDITIEDATKIYAAAFK
jgi:alcohol dehydrogenase class IV